MTQLRIGAFGPARSWVRPGSEARVSAALSADRPVTARADVRLLDVDRIVQEVSTDVDLGPEPTVVRSVLTLPDVPRRGYGLALELTAIDGSVASARSAVEALMGWWESPRHAAITEYAQAGAAAAATSDLAAWHVNVVQHYDWMWRHYRYRPPDGAAEFIDPLGRTISHDALRASLAAGHERGIAGLAYGAVYGAESEHVERFPDDRVFDDRGVALSLGGTFFINDIRPGSAWRARLLREYQAAVAEFGFDGIHMDTYGPPHTAVGVDGGPIDFAALYPGLIDEAAARLAASAPGTRVLFNCVEGYPLEAAAPTAAAALYLELWPPDDELADVVHWIDRARALAAGRAVVIAAYAATLKQDPGPAGRAAAFEAVPLLGSVIVAAGAYHHTLAERDRLLVEGYYPAAVPMVATEITELRALWRFGARYLQLLSEAGLTVAPDPDLDLRDRDGEPVPWTREPTAGAVWVRETHSRAGERVLHLVDLRGQSDTAWTTPKRPSPLAGGLHLAWAEGAELVAMSPWSGDGDAMPLPRDGASVPLPDFRRWLVVLAR